MIIPYQRIYFDTNVFVSSHWPSISTTLRNVVQFAQSFEVPIVLLEQVENEFKNHWFEETAEVTRSLERQAKSLTARLNEAGFKWSLKLPTVKSIQQAFNAKHEEAIHELGLLRAAPPFRNTAELFNMALAKQRPFEAKGKNFQDAVILLAVIDDMNACSIKEAAFVSNDGVFDEKVLQDSCRSSETKIHLFKDIDALWSDQARYFDKTMREFMEFSETIAKQEITDNLARIQSFLEENLEIPMTFGGLFSRRRLTRINRIEIADVRRVVFPISPDETVSDETIEESRTPESDSKLSAHIDVKIYATARVLRPTERESTTLKVGQSPPAPPTRAGSIYIEQEEVLNRVVLVEIERHVDAESKVHLTPTAVSFTTETNPVKRESSLLGIIPRIGEPRTEN